MLRISRIACFALLSLYAVGLCLPDLSAASSSSTSRLAQRRAYREAQSPSKPIKPTERLDLAEGGGSANSGKTQSQAQNNSANNSSQQRSQEDANDRQEDRYIAQGETPRGYRYDGGQRYGSGRYGGDPRYSGGRYGDQRYGGDQANRYARPNDAADYQPNYNPVPLGDWDNQQDWQYYRKEFYAGKTQPEVYREHHPYGAGGIGYDPDPDYLRMQRIERDYYNNNRGNVRNPR